MLDAEISHNIHFFPTLPFLFVKKTKGSKVWDADGNEYVDLLDGKLHPILGHRPRGGVPVHRKTAKEGIHWGHGRMKNRSNGQN